MAQLPIPTTSTLVATILPLRLPVPEYERAQALIVPGVSCRQAKSCEEPSSTAAASMFLNCYNSPVRAALNILCETILPIFVRRLSAATPCVAILLAFLGSDRLIAWGSV